MSRAAERLGQTQPNVSRSLKSLRVAFSDPLLVRSGRGMALTPVAEMLRVPIERVLGAVDRLVAVREFDPRTDHRTFRIVLPDVGGVRVLPGLLSRMNTEAPNVRIQVLGSEFGALKSLLTNEVDLVVGAAVLNHAELYQRSAAADIEWTTVLGPLHPSFGGELDLDAWLDSDHIQITPAGRPDVAGGVDTLLLSMGRERRIRLYVGYIGALPGILEATPYVVSLPRFIALELTKGRDLRIAPHPLGDRIPKAPLRLTWHQAHHSDPGDRWLRDLIAEVCGEWT